MSREQTFTEAGDPLNSCLHVRTGVECVPQLNWWPVKHEGWSGIVSRCLKLRVPRVAKKPSLMAPGTSNETNDWRAA